MPGVTATPKHVPTYDVQVKFSIQNYFSELFLYHTTITFVTVAAYDAILIDLSSVNVFSFSGPTSVKI